MKDLKPTFPSTSLTLINDFYLRPLHVLKHEDIHQHKDEAPMGCDAYLSVPDRRHKEIESDGLILGDQEMSWCASKASSSNSLASYFVSVRRRCLEM